MRFLTWLRGLFDFSWLLGPVDEDAGFSHPREVVDRLLAQGATSGLGADEIRALRELGVDIPPVQIRVDGHHYEVIPTGYARAVYGVIGDRARGHMICWKGRLLGDEAEITLAPGVSFALIPF